VTAFEIITVVVGTGGGQMKNSRFFLSWPWGVFFKLHENSKTHANITYFWTF
jgi:hypothetical protein